MGLDIIYNILNLIFYYHYIDGLLAYQQEVRGSMLQLQEVWLNILVEENSRGSDGHRLQKAGTRAEESALVFDHFNIFFSSI